MGWRLRVTHRTHYAYAGPVTASYNEARMTPLTNLAQTTIDAHLDVRPSARTFRYWDYWGNMVHVFDVRQPHEALTVTASAMVETQEWKPAAETAGWDVVRRNDTLDRLCEYLAPSTYVPFDQALAAEASALLAGHGGSSAEHDPAAGTPSTDPLAAATVANAWVYQHMAYRKGSTTVATSAPEAFGAGSGVCQDFAHVLLGLLRSMGIPSRYVSGYLYTPPPPARGDADPADAKTSAGESHAWVEAWVGDWVSLDPTNGGFAGPQHVLVARGRDYDDVTPLKGIFSGAPLHSLDVTVELTRIS